jgi:hypothetical protein
MRWKLKNNILADETHADIYQEVFTPPTRNEVLKINTLEKK